MQIDHIVSKRNGGTDDIINLNPACRLCNHYKNADPLESFRNWALGGIIKRIMKVYIFRVALKYGMIEIRNWDKKFYFEKNGGQYMTEENKHKICSEAVLKYGYGSQCGMAIEEMGELMSAINKFNRERVLASDVVTEIADVTIMMMQLSVMFGRENVEKEIEYKLERLKKNLRERKKQQ